ncbi:anaerobic ribonucleoside-triphosphate reductase activating protein [Patescibacteria group bacterium]|nr:anaerobic ribonucleoside-triphosphate reductase activating protein [Patescibacteria group bacterium]
MRIAGYQPLTLIDYPGHVASIVFTQGCPFRCVYCHNPELIPSTSDSEISEESILKRIKEDAAMLDGVVVTGGEPTTHPDLPEFLKKIKDLGLRVKLDTNGVNPRLIERCLQKEAVDFFAMDVKHRWEKYNDVIGETPDIAVENCRKTFTMIQDCGIDHEFRTTIYSALHNEEDIMTIAGYLKPGELYALQQVRYEKTLTPDLAQMPPLNLDEVMSNIKRKFPGLQVAIKT